MCWSAIPQAAIGLENVHALVYVAAFAPEEGENAIELSGHFPGSTLGESLRPVMLADGSTDLYIQSDKFHARFAADVTADKAALMASTKRSALSLNNKEGSFNDRCAYQ